VPNCTNVAPIQYEICESCLLALGADLHELAHGPEVRPGEFEPGLIDDLVDVMARLTRSGLSTGVGSRSATTPLLYNESASDLLWTVRNTLSVWCAEIYTRNPQYGEPHGSSPRLASWLSHAQLGVVRHPGAVSLRDEVTWMTTQVRRTVDIAPVRVYLGECGAQPEGRVCREPIYALPSHTTARCRGCGAVYDVVVRRGQLLDSAQDQLAPAGDIARALSTLGQPLSLRRIRVWVHRGRLVQYEPHPFDPKRRPRYRLGDVVTLLLANSAQTKGGRTLDRVAA
jgi:hypothetical protein